MAARVHAAGYVHAGLPAKGRGRVIRLRRRRQQRRAKGKGLALGLALALILAAAVAALVAGGVRSTWKRPAPWSTVADDVGGSAYQVVKVKPGDTLWSLARRYGSPDQGIAQRVAVLQALNGLEGSFLRAGMELKVPVAGDGSLPAAGAQAAAQEAGGGERP